MDIKETKKRIMMVHELRCEMVEVLNKYSKEENYLRTEIAKHICPFKIGQVLCKSKYGKNLFLLEDIRAGRDGDGFPEYVMYLMPARPQGRGFIKKYMRNTGEDFVVFKGQLTPEQLEDVEKVKMGSRR